jgi:hypothetical protein
MRGQSLVFVEVDAIQRIIVSVNSRNRCGAKPSATRHMNAKENIVL